MCRQTSFLDGIAPTPVSGSVSEWVTLIVSDLEIDIASPSFVSLFQACCTLLQASTQSLLSHAQWFIANEGLMGDAAEEEKQWKVTRLLLLEVGACLRASIERRETARPAKQTKRERRSFVATQRAWFSMWRFKHKEERQGEQKCQKRMWGPLKPGCFSMLNQQVVFRVSCL